MMRFIKQFLFWLGATLVMSALYAGSMGSFANAIFLAGLLLPGALFLSTQIARLRKASGWTKWLHFAYVMLISLYLEWLGLIAAYWFLFELKLERIPDLMINPVFLSMWMLFFVFIRDRLFAKKTVLKREELMFEITSERKKMHIRLKEVFFIESKDEVCFIHMEGHSLKTRERISQLAERLPEGFIRTHRSFLVNTEHIKGHSKNSLFVDGLELPVSRKYKDATQMIFNENNPSGELSN